VAIPTRAIRRGFEFYQYAYILVCFINKHFTRFEISKTFFVTVTSCFVADNRRAARIDGTVGSRCQSLAPSVTKQFNLVSTKAGRQTGTTPLGGPSCSFAATVYGWRLSETLNSAADYRPLWLRKHLIVFSCLWEATTIISGSAYWVYEHCKLAEEIG